MMRMQDVSEVVFRPAWLGIGFLLRIDGDMLALSSSSVLRCGLPEMAPATPASVNWVSRTCLLSVSPSSSLSKVLSAVSDSIAAQQCMGMEVLIVRDGCFSDIKKLKTTNEEVDVFGLY
jgi:hypothetical protein